MPAISNLTVSMLAPPNVPATWGPVNAAANRFDPPNYGQPAGGKDELRDTFNRFVGEAFYGQMMKAMRSTVGKPAYFHGGHAEEVFQGQLDQAMVEHLTEAGSEKISKPLFARQFPHLADELNAETASRPALNDLKHLSRR
jgi:hypothetical protein